MYFKEYITFIILLSTSCNSLLAQNMEDSIKTAVKHRPILYGNIGGKNAFIKNERAGFRHIQGGLNFNNRIYLGLSYNFLTEKILYYDEIQQGNQLDMEYIGGFFEYYFFTNKRWDFSIPVQLGYGNLSLITPKQTILSQSPFFIYEASMSSTYKFHRYFGLSLNLGYRVVFKNNKTINTRFTSPTYSAGLSVFLGSMWRDLRKVIF